MYKKEFPKLDMTATFWNSPAEFGREYFKHWPDKRDADTYFGDRDGEPTSKSAERMITGSTDGVAEAKKLLDKVLQEVELPRPEWRHARAGAFADVPSFLTGRPDSMMHKTHVVSNRAPLKIVVDITGSAGAFSEVMGVKMNPMQARGVALLATVMALSEVRPVSVQIISGWGSYGHHNGATIINVPTVQLDLATAANALSDPQIASPTKRYCVAKLGGAFGWEWGLYPTYYNDGTPNDARRIYEARYRIINDMAPTDMYIPPLSLNDPVLKDPVGFVMRTYKEHVKMSEDWDA